jgi:TolB protein
MQRLPVVAVPFVLGLVAVAAAMLGPGMAAGSTGSRGTLLMVSSLPVAHAGFVTVSLVDGASGKRRVVLRGKDDFCCTAAWSPDGKWIALAKLDGVVLLDRDGRHPRTLPQLNIPPGRSGASRSFAWAPNSRSLAVNEGNGHRLVVRGIDGGARVIRRTGDSTLMLRVTWSPDGRWISYDRDDIGGDNGVGCCSMTLHLIRPDGTGDHVVAVMREAIHDTPGAALWAPGGQRFAFTTDARDVRDPVLALVDARSGTLTVIPMPTPNVFPIAWSADGSGFAVVQGGEPTSLLLIDASGRSQALATALPPWGLAGGRSADGKLVIAGAQVSSSGEVGAVDLELIDPAGGAPSVLTQLPRGSEVRILDWRPHARAR